MPKLNIYDFLTSDIAAHCENIGHTFNPLEMAVIVGYSRKTVKEKLAAWQTIIDECPDMPIRPNDAEKTEWWQKMKRDNPDIDSGDYPLQPCAKFKAKESLHEFLRDYISQHEKVIAEFFACGDGVIFRPHPYWTDNENKREYDEEIGCYSTFEKALNAVRAEDPELEIRKIEMRKGKIDENFSEHESALFNSNGELINIWYFKGMPKEELTDIFIHLPVPFEKGDIVTDDDGSPCVLVCLPIWDKTSYEELTSGRDGDGTDQSGLAFNFKEDTPDGGSFDHSHPCTYYLEYYKKELHGRDRFLKAFSQYIKTRDQNNPGSPAVLLIEAFRKYQSEAEAKRLANIWDDWIHHSL